jgi:hypothetical protein
MNIIIYLTNGKRVYINNVAEILMARPHDGDYTGDDYISIVYLNLDTCYYDSKNWKASEVKNITCRDFD